MAKDLELKIYPDPILRQKAGLVSPQQLQEDSFRQLILNMEKTMVDNKGIGLAAPQIGLSIRLCVVNTQDGVVALINPKILSRSWKKEVDEEGCLSIPGVYGLVKRNYKIKISTLDQRGKKISFSAKGLLARVIQHEIDHLDGILLIDKAEKITQGEDTLAKLNSVEKL